MVIQCRNQREYEDTLRWWGRRVIDYDDTYRRVEVDDNADARRRFSAHMYESEGY
jgi:hypothetical protein